MAKSVRVLATGGAGYLGSILCEHLLSVGYRVTVLDSLLYGQLRASGSAGMALRV